MGGTAMNGQRELYACLYAKESPAQAMLRLRPELRQKTVVVMEGEPPLQSVCAMNEKARRLGITRGMTAEQPIADFVKHRAGAIARGDAGGFVQPFRAAGSPDAEAEIASVPGQVEGKLGLVSRIGPEGGVAAIERTVEELAAVLDHEVLAVWGVTERPLDVAGQIGLKSGSGRRILPGCAAGNEERDDK